VVVVAGAAVVVVGAAVVDVVEVVVFGDPVHVLDTVSQIPPAGLPTQSASPQQSPLG
jgi:hypothetical protein